MKFSLILPVLGERNSIFDLLNSLVNQEYKDFEVVIVDQNKSNYLRDIVATYKTKLHIKYICSNQKGLSFNRNLGIKHAIGEILAFPDDDCFYKIDTLKIINDFFTFNSEFNIFSCNYQDPNTKIGADFLKGNQTITKKNIMKSGSSICFFYKPKLGRVEYFDEELGLGSEFPSGEETDFISNLLSKGNRGYYMDEFLVYHKVGGEKLNFDRYYNYGKGFGALLKKEVFLRKNYYFLINLLKYLLKGILGLMLVKKEQLYFINGISSGFKKYIIKK